MDNRVLWQQLLLKLKSFLDQTPFYAEMGGQLADQGYIRFAGMVWLKFMMYNLPVKGVPVHRGTLIEGDIALNDTCIAEIDIKRRLDIARVIQQLI